MLDIMYEIPKDDNIGSVLITEDYINNKGVPVIMMRGQEALPVCNKSWYVAYNVLKDYL